MVCFGGSRFRACPARACHGWGTGAVGLRLRPCLVTLRALPKNGGGRLFLIVRPSAFCAQSKSVVCGGHFRVFAEGDWGALRGEEEGRAVLQGQGAPEALRGPPPAAARGGRGVSAASRGERAGFCLPFSTIRCARAAPFTEGPAPSSSSLPQTPKGYVARLRPCVPEGEALQSISPRALVAGGEGPRPTVTEPR